MSIRFQLFVVLIFLTFILISDASYAARSYRMVYSFTPKVSANIGFWVPIPTPRDKNGVVDTEIVKISPPTGSRMDVETGNKAVRWPDSDLNRQLTVTFDVELAPVTLQVNPNTTYGSYNTHTQEYLLYTAATSYVQSDDPTIVNRATSIVGNNTNPYIKAKLIYNWVNSNLKPLNSFSPDALTALSNLGGHCGSYANLFVALCRAVGIPARNISGFLAHNQGFAEAGHFSSGSWTWTQSNRGFSAHVWAEFMLPNGVWVQVDASDPTHGLFGSIPSERVILSKGSRIILDPKEPGEHNWFHLPVGAGQIEDSSVRLSITYLGTSGIEHPDPSPTAAMPLSVIYLLLD